MRHEDFIVLPRVSKIKEKGVCGVGTNDGSYITQIKSGNRTFRDPAYTAWVDMLKRGYSSTCKKKNPTYEHTTVCNSWHTFSNFLKWWEEFFVEGWALDKDILFPGNTVYSPDKCVFIPQYVNSLFTLAGNARGILPLGVHWDKVNSKFSANVRVGGIYQHLGRFPNLIQAHRAWQLGKIAAIEHTITKYVNEPHSEHRIVEALHSRITRLREDYDNLVETTVL